MLNSVYAAYTQFRHQGMTSLHSQHAFLMALFIMIDQIFHRCCNGLQFGYRQVRGNGTRI